MERLFLTACVTLKNVFLLSCLLITVDRVVHSCLYFYLRDVLLLLAPFYVEGSGVQNASKLPRHKWLGNPGPPVLKSERFPLHLFKVVACFLLIMICHVIVECKIFMSLINIRLVTIFALS